MPISKPVSAIEVYLHIWAVPLLLLACACRLVWGYVSTGNIWLSEMQLLTVCLLIALLVLAGSLLAHRQASLAVSVVFGLASWAAALTMLPPGLWSGYPLLRSDVPVWLLLASIILCLGSLALRWWLARRWLKSLTGHGFAWMHNWVSDRPLYTRLLVQRVLANLGYRFPAQ